MLNGKHLELIKDTIQTELLKRGFHAPITVTEQVDKNPRVLVTSENFQTTPVLFKNIKIVNFSGNIEEVEQDFTGINNKKETKTIIKFWIPVQVRYEHFDLGGNGSRLFNLEGFVFRDEDSDRIYGLVIS